MNKELTINKTDLAKKADLYSDKGFNQFLQIANIFSDSTMIPDTYKGNVANCFVAAQMASELGISPLVFMQHSYALKGKVGIEAKLAISLANNSGLLVDSIEYEYKGEDLKMECTASAILVSNGKKISFTVSMKMAIDEGWYHERKDKNGQYFCKWKTLQKLMLCYRAAMFLIRTNIPQVIVGLQSKEELIDVYGDPIIKNITPEKEDLSKLEITEPTIKTLEIEDPPKEKVVGIAEYFEKLGIEKDLLEKHLNKDYDDFDEEDIEKLRNIYSSINKKEMSVEDFKEMNQ